MRKSPNGTNNVPQNETIVNPFTQLLRDYEKLAITRTPQTEAEYAKALQDLSRACVYGVLKKLYNVSGSKTITQLRQSITQDTANLDRLAYAIDNATETQYNADGEPMTVIQDSSLAQATRRLLDHCIGDGSDIVNMAVLAIMDETVKTIAKGIGFMESPYEVRRLKRKVYIKKADSVGGYETVITTPIQEVYRAIRREVESNRAVQVANNKYTYLEDIATDSETETENAIYRRLPKYSGLAYEMTDYNGKVTAITADNETVNTVDKIIDKMNLTAKEAKVLQLRLSGYGDKAIATYLGITIDNAKRCRRRLQEKAEENGLTFEF